MATEINKQDVSGNGSDQVLYYDKLNFIPVEQKDKVWAAKWIFFAKLHCMPFHDPSLAFDIRRRMNGYLDENAHKKIIDPDKGLATYFHSDWKSCPIGHHLDEIVEATIKQIPINISVKAVDEQSISNKQANNRKILKKGFMTNIINMINKDLGFPQLQPGADPFQYIEQMSAQLQQAQQPQAAPPAKPANKAQGIGSKQMRPTDVIQSLVSQIDNNELLGVYNQYLHKEGVEIACELGIDYYLNVKNKFVVNHASDIIQDIKGLNKCCGRMYTSQTTGTPIIETYRPENVYIMNYSKRDISDHGAWYVEEDTTFSNFMRLFGADLKEDELRCVFDMNCKYFGLTATYDKCDAFARNNAKIRYAYIEFESQDMEVYADYTTKEGNKSYKKMASDFQPGYRKEKGGKLVKDPNVQDSVRDESHYNVWYKCYFIPYSMIGTSNGSTGTTQYEKQAEYIFKFGKLQDQERYGDDEQFSRSSLWGHYSDRITWFEIQDRFKGKIDHLWMLFQNDIANIQPHGLVWTYDLIVLMSKISDDVNLTNKGAAAEWAAKLRQTGSTIAKLLRDAAGNPMPNVAPFQEIKTGHLEAALGKLDAIMVLYNLMVKALGQNELSEGGAPKPRTNLGSVQLALGTSGKSTFYIEEAYSDVVSSIGNKLLKYFKDIVDLGDSKRLQEFEDMVGQANSAALKEIKDIPMRNLGLYAENSMTKDQKEMLMQIAQSMAAAGTLDESTALFLTFVDNLKYAYAILVFKKAQMDKQKQAEVQQQQQFQMDLIDKQTQLELTKIAATGQTKMDFEKLVGQIQSTLIQMEINLKGHWTLAGKEQIKQNRIEQDITASQIDKLNAPEDSQLPERKNMAGAGA